MNDRLARSNQPIIDLALGEGSESPPLRTGEAPLSFRHLDYDVRDHVAEITMRRDPVNAIDHALIEDILEAYRLAKADPDVRAIILTSALAAAVTSNWSTV